ncbi:MAG TPA: hypothetical protein VGQ06_03595 [Gemmatimonadales bacterium]|jgi:hypothetical protein|nr:hypothetical protein [Gemmatimonadales bacterium]
MNTRAEGALGLVVGAVVLTVAACAPPPHTPAPPSLVTNAESSSQRAAVLAYAATLQFDTLTHGASDMQPLTLKNSSAVPPKDTVGPVGTIYPEVNTHRNSQADLAGVGRIVARIYTTGPYPRLGLPAGWSYFWVDSLKMITPDSGVGRALLIPADSTQPISVRMLKYTTDPAGAPERQAMARWRYYPLQSALPWERCTKMGCCEAQ